PGADGLDQYLGALLLEKLEHVEVSVALGGLGPEFAGYLGRRLHARAVDRDSIKPVTHLVERRRVVVSIELIEELTDEGGGSGEGAALLEHRRKLAFQGVGKLAPHHLVQQVHALVEHAVRLTRVYFVGANLVGDVVDDVADVQGVQDAEEEGEVHLEARLGL